MRARHPEIAKRWDAKYGGKIGGDRKMKMDNSMMSAIKRRRRSIAGGRGKAMPMSSGTKRMQPMASGRSIAMPAQGFTPPGLAKKGGTPPGLAKKGGTPPGLVKTGTPLQQAIRRRMESRAAKK